MAHTDTYTPTVEQRACLALWAIPGLGPRTLDGVRAFAGGALSRLASAPVRDWVSDVPVPAPVRQRLATVASLDEVASRVEAACARADIQVAFAGTPAHPARLVGLEDAPPLLFHRGQPGPPRRRLGMVGSRHPDQGFLPFARTFARKVAEAGVGVVSGAAEGVDRACHWGALDVGGETWAFLGSALDALDPAQARLLPHFLERGGVFFSELPPGVRASTTTFPRRNRLIAGASDAVLVMRAAHDSGSLYTAEAARTQGRPVFALPGELWQPAAAGCNALLADGRAQACTSAEAVCAAVGVHPVRAVPAGRDGGWWQALSAEARGAYGLLDRVPRSFDEVLAGSPLSPAALTSALVELELSGLVVQHPGKRYEKV
ncbi:MULTISPECIES: DNA-processing protein DprA [Corallococcus]|uniref:DNA-processing protein DprA n=1 Tax=Corallococcus TaxID=83461 RepID=UPI001180DC0A|nr:MULTISPECIES: DNA-processing protein DprA [Corallococcus]NBD10946.1 DNA-processing protein DprA [Corallococcus silvisoli]TSC31618.1 DNA-processing protein DprA [Corallococcus sp. Z5C101001]